MARVVSDYDPEEAILEPGAYDLEDEALPEPVPDPRIIDLTARTDRSRRKGTRDPKKVYALVLHQMACCFNPRNPLERFLTVGAHFAITNDGRILRLHPVSALLWASNHFNPGSVAVEFAGNFPDVRGTWWKGAEYGRNRPTPPQIDGGRHLVRYLMRTMGLTHILAHRQSSGTRENDPGPDIWYHVGQWAVDTLGLNDGGPGFKVGTGNPIPAQWRTWARPPVTPEIDAALAAESPDTELAHDVWHQEDETSSPEYIRWVQRSLNEVMGLRLPVDGVAGPATRSAVGSFQARQGLPVTAIIGTDTEDALKLAHSGSGFRSRRARRRAGRSESEVGEGGEEEQPDQALRVIARPFVLAQIAVGERDPYKLTDRVFYLRHKELQGRRISPGETALKTEWLSILRDVVQPALASAGLSTTVPPVPARVGDRVVADALQIARREVSGMPGTTIEQLVQQWRQSICREIPWPILLAFIKYESGGNFGDATHGTEKNGWTSPEFYELGLFQTPAGLHGRCTGRHWRSCAIEPPGEENPRNPSPWARNCARIGADPAQWTNPTTQVRVGLLDLEDGAIALRRDFPELFPSPGSDWDLRMAVLYRFSRGGGYARSFLSGYRRELAAMPEAHRWNFLRDKTVTATVTVKGKRVTVRRDFKGENVEEKMALAGKLGYVPRTA